jgi:hypothetical protein
MGLWVNWGERKTHYWAEPLTLGAGPIPPVQRKAMMGGRQSPRVLIVLYTLGPAPLITDDECKRACMHMCVCVEYIKAAGTDDECKMGIVHPQNCQHREGGSDVIKAFPRQPRGYTLVYTSQQYNHFIAEVHNKGGRIC